MLTRVAVIAGMILCAGLTATPYAGAQEDEGPIVPAGGLSPLNPFISQQARFSNVQYNIYPIGFDLNVPLITGGNIKAGPLLIHPHMGLAESYTDNVTRTDTTFGGRVSDWYTTYAPGIQVQLPIQGRHKLIFDYRTNLERYSRDQSLDVSDQTRSLGLVLNFPGGLTVKGLGELKDGHDYRGSATATGTTAAINKFYNEEFGGEALLESRLFIRARAKYIGWQFLGPLAGSRIPGTFGDINTRNRKENYGSLAVGGRVAPKTYAYLEGLVQQENYEVNKDLDSTIYTALVGAQWQAMAKTMGNFGIGWQNRVYDHSSQTRGTGKFSGLYFNGNLKWKPQEQTQVNLAVYRQTNETVLAQTRFFIATGTTLDVRHALTRKWHAIAQFMFEHDSYSDPITADGKRDMRRDNYTTLGGGVLYQVQPWLGARLNYLYTERLSNFVSPQYTASQVMLSIQGQF